MATLICIECDAVFSSRRDLQAHQKTSHAFRTGDEGSDEEGLHLSTTVAEAALQHDEDEGDAMRHVKAALRGGNAPQQRSSGGRGRQQAAGGGGGGGKLPDHSRGAGDRRGGGFAARAEQHDIAAPHFYVSGQNDQLKPAPTRGDGGGSARGPAQRDSRSAPRPGAPAAEDDSARPARGASGRPQRGEGGCEGGGRGRGRGRVKAAAQAPAGPQADELSQPKLLRRPASDLQAPSANYRAVPGPTIGAAAEAAHQDAAAQHEVDAAAAAMAAMTGVGGGRRKKATPREKPAADGDALAFDAEGQQSAAAMSKRAGGRQRQRGGRGLGQGGEDAAGSDGLPAVICEAAGDGVAGASEAIRRERGPAARSKGGSGRVTGADAAASPSPHGGQSPDGASGAGKPGGGKAVSGKLQRRGAAAITFVTCPVCSSNFYSALVLRQHVRDEHPGADVKIDDVPRGPAKPKLPEQQLPALVTSQSWADMDDS